MAHSPTATATPETQAETAKSSTLLTIDELARRVGMTVRNLREWRTIGLLPEPEMHGRVGYYDAEVVARIEGIQKLRAEGFNLELIRRMLEASGGASGEVMRLAWALRAPFRDDVPPVVGRAELAERWGVVGPDEVSRVVEVGLARELADGRLELANALVGRVGDALNRLGLSFEEIVEGSAVIRKHADGITDLFEQVWLEHIWEPFVEAGMPEAELPELQRKLAEVQPLALDAVVAIFTVAMEAKVERSIAREVERAISRTRGDR